MKTSDRTIVVMWAIGFTIVWGGVCVGLGFLVKAIFPGFYEHIWLKWLFYFVMFILLIPALLCSTGLFHVAFSNDPERSQKPAPYRQEILPQLQEVRNKIEDLAKKINAFEYIKNYFDKCNSHIDIDSSGFHLVDVERGIEIGKSTTQDIDELLFWVFKKITFEQAVNFESKNKAKRQDPRRIIFKRQLELLGILNPIWQARVESEIQGKLSIHPFDDNKST